MKKLSLITALFCLSIPSFAMDATQNLINTAYEKNYKLKSLESSLDVAQEQISISSKFSNPILSFGANDIWLSDFSNRDSEAMQAYFVGISQSIPLTNKLQTKEMISKNDYVISKYELEEKKVFFASKIKEYLYNIALLQERIVLYTKLENNTKNLENILNELYTYGKVKQTQILNTQVLLEELKLKKIELYNFLKVQTINLEKITYTQFDTFQVNTKVKKLDLNLDISQHPKILSLQELEKKFNNVSKYEKEKKSSDLKMNLSYFERDDKYEDYINLSFAIPLSIYGTEDLKSRKAKFKTIEIKNKTEDLKFNFINQIKILQENMNTSLKAYTLIKNEVIPKLNQVQKNLENYTSFANANSSALIKNLNEIIKYELKAINEKQKYFTSYAKSTYFTKENK